MANEAPDFHDYANFDFTKDKVELPVKNPPEMSERIAGLGGFTTTVELGGGKVAKLSRMLAKTTKTKYGSIEREDALGGKYLVDKSESVDLDNSEVTAALLELAKDKQHDYEMAGTYIGDYLPQIYLFAIVESPRREIEKYSQRPPKEDADLLDIPASEKSLMEVWEQVDAKKALSRASYTQLQELNKNPNFSAQMKGFAQGAFKLFQEQGIMLDICDAGGVRARNQMNQQTEVLTTRGMSSFRAVELELYPRNMCWDGERLILFDLYPNPRTEDYVTTPTQTELVQAVKDKDWEQVEELISKGNQSRALQVARYIFFLERLGAEL